MNKVEWTDLKAQKNARKVNFTYIEFNNYYDIELQDSLYHANCTVTKSTPRNTDQIDFEDNYKADSNKPSVLEIRDTETTEFEKFFGAEVTAGGTESEQAFVFTPANGEIWTIKEFWVIAPMDRNAFVSLMWDYEGAGESELLFGKGGEKYKPQNMTVTGDGVKELAIVLCNCATSGSVKLAGLLKYNKA